MTIKSTLITQANNKPVSYPALGQYKNGRIVLFTAPGVGTLVKTAEPDIYYNSIGHWSDWWQKDDIEFLSPGTKIVLEVK